MVRLSVAVVVHTTRLDGTALQIQAIAETLTRYGATIEEVVECGFDPRRQNRELERLAWSRPSAVISLPLGGAVTVDAHRGLAGAGVRVVLMDNVPSGLLPVRDYVCVVSADNFGLGEVGLSDDTLRQVLAFPITVMAGTQDTKTTGRRNDFMEFLLTPRR